MLEINKRYTINTIDANNLGATLKLMKVKSILAYDDAIKIKDVATLHQQIRKNNAGIPADVTGLIFYKMENQNGDTVVLADVWIDSSTEVTTTNIVCTVKNVSSDELTTIRQTLEALGYSIDTEIITL